MKKNLTKKLMLSVLTLAFAVVSLGASTFAWFTVAKTATVDTFTADVISGAGIEIAVGDIDSAITVVTNADGSETITTSGVVSQFYIGKVPTSAITNAVKGTASSVSPLNNVSTAKAAKASNFAGVFYDAEGKETTEGYYAFKFYVRSELGGKIVLNNFALSEKDGNVKTPWAAGIDYKDAFENYVDADEKVAYSILNAARIGLICQNATNAVYQAPLATAAEGSKPAKGSNSTGFKGKDLGALAVYNGKYVNDTEKQIPELTAEQIPAWETTALDWTTGEIVLDVLQDTVYEIKVYVWIEGYDAECYNAIFSQVLKGQFAFTWHDQHTYDAEDKCTVCGTPKPAANS